MEHRESSSVKVSPLLPLHTFQTRRRESDVPMVRYLDQASSRRWSRIACEEGGRNLYCDSNTW